LAQSGSHEFRVGVLRQTAPPSSPQDPAATFLPKALAELGYVEGRNLVIEARRLIGDVERLPALARDLVQARVDVVVAVAVSSVRAAVAASATVPVVFFGNFDPANDFFFRAMAVRAKALGVQLDRVNVAAAGELDAAIERARGGGLVVVGDPMFATNRVLIVELVRRFQVPAMYSSARLFMDAGGLMSYLAPDSWHWRSAAGFVDRILKGAKPADLPVEQPTQFELIINLKTAKALGITIPQSVLLRADEVIQ